MTSYRKLLKGKVGDDWQNIKGDDICNNQVILLLITTVE